MRFAAQSHLGVWAVGYLDMSTVMDARLRWNEEAHFRERRLPLDLGAPGFRVLPGE